MKTEKNINYSAKGIAGNTLHLFYPENAEVKSLFVFFHGGGLTDGDHTYDFEAQYLTKAGFAVASVNYRLYPNAKFPEFIEDCAEAVAWVIENARKYVAFDHLVIGGSSAGAYLAMMLYFDRRYLAAYGIDSQKIEGYIFDAGQPTTHFNVLAERGLDSRLVRIDEAAPLYFIDKDILENEKTPQFLIFAAEHDMQNRLEQTQLLIQTMLHFGYHADQIHFKFMKGYQHCEYGATIEFLEMMADFMRHIGS